MAMRMIEHSPGERILFYGIGNVAREDDGLGVRLIERLVEAGLPEWVGLECNYQLNAEDALLISEYDVVFFVDATLEEEARTPFDLHAVEPSAEIGFSTHAMSAGSVVGLCEQLYGKKPRAFLMAIPGYKWEISESLTEAASRNLAEAFDAVMSMSGAGKVRAGPGIRDEPPARSLGAGSLPHPLEINAELGAKSGG